jgi:hypothetical protein
MRNVSCVEAGLTDLNGVGVEVHGRVVQYSG